MKAKLAAALAALAFLAPTLPAAAQDAASLANARKWAAQDAEQPADFLAGAKMADLLAGQPGPEAALVRYQVIARALTGVTYENREQAAIKTWLDKHEDEVIFSEPAGQYFVSRQKIWALYDTSRSSPLAEEIAWEAARTPAGGECEGYLNCYLADSLDSTGRYLELYPKGRHAAAALEELYWLQEEPSGVAPIDKADVPEAKRLLARWKKILVAAPGAKDYVKGVDMIAGAYGVK